MGFPGGSVVKNPLASAGDVGLIPESGRSPGEGNGNPLQHSCLENPMDRGVWWATVHGVTKESDMTEQLNNNNSHASSPGNKKKCKKNGIFNCLIPYKVVSRISFVPQNSFVRKYKLIYL